MAIKKKFIEKIKSEEGFKVQVHQSKEGFLTWGYGHNLNIPIPQHIFQTTINVSKFRGIMELLEWDLQRAIDGLTKNCPWWSKMPDSVQIALVDMAYELEIGGLLSFSKFLLFLKKKEYVWAIKDLKQSVYYKESKGRAFRNIKLIEGCV